MPERIGEVLKRMMAVKGLSQRKFAELSGVDREYINQIVAGKVTSVTLRTASKLARGLGVAASDLLGEEQRSPEAALADLEVTIRAFIPVYGEVSAGAGVVPIDYVACTRAKPAPDSYRAFRVKGLCLEPEIHEGDTLIVDTEAQPLNGDLVVCIIEGEASVKRFQDTGAERWLENNSGRYRPEDVYMVGVVVEFNRKRH